MEPERKIEKWLRAFAKKRRDQAGEPMELRPAARQLLQREIARQSQEKNRGGFFLNLLSGPRLRLVFAACFTALVIGGWFVWRESAGTQPAQLSMNKTSYPETPSNAAPAETPPPAVMSPAVASVDKKVFEDKPKSPPTAPQPAPPSIASANRTLTAPPKGQPTERDRAANTAAQKQLLVTTAAAPTPGTNTLFAYKNEIAADSLTPGSALAKDAGSTLPSVAVPPAHSLAAGTIASETNLQTALAFQKAMATTNSTSTALFDAAKTTGAVTVSQMFNRRDASSTRRAEAGALKIPAPVLASFRVEQNGNNLKVVDGDGSVYTGSVQIAQQEPASDYSFAAAKNTPVGTAARSVKTDAPKPQGYFFRVAGTNRELNENIVFSGNFVPLTNDQLTAGTRGFGGARAGGGFGGTAGFGGGGGAGSDQAASQPIQAILSNSQIDGNVVIGDQKAMEITATPLH